MKPVVIDDVTLAFPANIGNLLPTMDEIPEAFKGQNGWTQLAAIWFYEGLRDPKFHMVEGIDGATAHRHLSAVLSSFEPKHEHKMAAVAYLMSLWFTQVTFYFKGETRTVSHE